jgi:hypothetical protein
MSPRIRFCLAIAYALAALVALFYAYLFEHLLQPSLPVIPLAIALLGLMSAGAAGFQFRRAIRRYGAQRMRQFHARAHFHRVEIADNRRVQMLADYRARWVDSRGTGIRAIYESARYQRLCRAGAMYRVAGYLNPQEI